VVKVGEKIEVKILRVDTDDRKIGLSRKRVEWAEDDLSDIAPEAGGPTPKESKKSRGELKGGLGGGGPLIAPPTEGGA
jgi:small subunit ribosomal protein S1